MENELATPKEPEQFDQNQPVILFYPESNHVSLTEEVNQLNEPNLAVKHKENESCSNIVSIVDGSVIVTRKEESKPVLTESHGSNNYEACASQNTTDLRNDDHAIVISEGEVQTYFDNSSEAQEFLVLNQDTGLYQKYLYLPPTDVVENQENCTNNILEDYKDVAKKRANEEYKEATKETECDAYVPNKQLFNPLEVSAIKFQCPKCTKTFHSQELLNLHYNHMHGEDSIIQLTDSTSNLRESTNDQTQVTKKVDIKR